MNFEEARQVLLEGKKVRWARWVSTNYIYLNKYLILKDQYNAPFYLDDIHLNNEWALFEEPKMPFLVQTLEWFKSEDKMPVKNSFIFYQEKNPNELIKKYNNNIFHAWFWLSEEDKDRQDFINHVLCWAYSGDVE